MKKVTLQKEKAKQLTDIFGDKFIAMSDNDLFCATGTKKDIICLYERFSKLLIESKILDKEELLALLYLIDYEISSTNEDDKPKNMIDEKFNLIN